MNKISGVFKDAINGIQMPWISGLTIEFHQDLPGGESLLTYILSQAQLITNLIAQKHGSKKDSIRMTSFEDLPKTHLKILLHWNFSCGWRSQKVGVGSH